MFELAHGGTILLDEIGDMDVRLQAKLLQVLQDHDHRIGGKDPIKVDVRVMAATHRDLEKAIGERSPRRPLLPAQRDQRRGHHRERIEDIVPMAEFLIKRHAVSGVSMVLSLPNSGRP
jgi:two-component system response regulator AtoC